eukprot:gene9876-7948_t
MRTPGARGAAARLRDVRVRRLLAACIRNGTPLRRAAGPLGLTVAQVEKSDVGTRFMLYEVATNHKRAVIHWHLYGGVVVPYYGACTVLRGDQGTENLWAYEWQRVRGLWADPRPSDTNSRIERHWGDTRSQLLDAVMLSLALLEQGGNLIRGNVLDEDVLHAVLLPFLNERLAEAAVQSNATPRRFLSGYSPAWAFGDYVGDSAPLRRAGEEAVRLCDVAAPGDLTGAEWAALVAATRTVSDGTWQGHYLVLRRAVRTY